MIYAMTDIFYRRIQHGSFPYVCIGENESNVLMYYNVEQK